MLFKMEFKNLIKMINFVNKQVGGHCKTTLKLEIVLDKIWRPN